MNNHKETVLVTGATGTVCSEVVKHLAALSPTSSGLINLDNLKIKELKSLILILPSKKPLHML
jgi:FlaA1/EpsC-like NDP-sugar epimerase